MDEAIRRVIAYAAAVQIEGKQPATVYSHELNKHFSMTANHDYESGSPITGIDQGTIFLHKTNTHIMFQANGQNFTGFDHSTSTHFQGSINNGTVILYEGSSHRTYIV